MTTRRPRGPAAPRRAVLGIDAAWTTGEASGVAMIIEVDGRWRCRAVAPSYGAVSALAAGRELDWECGPRGAPPDAGRLLEDLHALSPDAEVVVAAVDMPLSPAPITRRRVADDEISRAFGARGCGTHSPSASRPGPVADAMFRSFSASGFRLATRPPPGGRDLLEVFPHIAVMALLGAAYRVPYKIGRSAQYWPGTAPADRAAKLVATWQAITRALRRDVDGIDLPLPARPISLAGLKRYEDALDALVCAWVGMQYLRGRARPYGDASAAIWTVEIEPRETS